MKPNVDARRIRNRQTGRENYRRFINIRRWMVLLTDPEPLGSVQPNRLSTRPASIAVGQARILIPDVTGDDYGGQASQLAPAIAARDGCTTVLAVVSNQLRLWAGAEN